MHDKNYISRFAKTIYNLERKKYYLLLIILKGLWGRWWSAVKHATSRKLLLPVTCVHAQTHAWSALAYPVGGTRIEYTTPSPSLRSNFHQDQEGSLFFFLSNWKERLPAAHIKMQAGRGRCMRWWTEKSRLEKYGSGFGATHRPIEADTALGGQRGLVIWHSMHDE